MSCFLIDFVDVHAFQDDGLPVYQQQVVGAFAGGNGLYFDAAEADGIRDYFRYFTVFPKGEYQMIEGGRFGRPFEHAGKFFFEECIFLFSRCERQRTAIRGDGVLRCIQ